MLVALFDLILADMSKEVLLTSLMSSKPIFYNVFITLGHTTLDIHTNLNSTFWFNLNTLGISYTKEYLAFRIIIQS